MKTAVSIWCGVMLTLFAVSAMAQIDSNSIVTLNFTGIGEYSNTPITYCGGNPSGTDTEGYSNPVCGIEFDTSFLFSFNDSVHLVAQHPSLGSGEEDADFFVDTVSKCFRHVKFFGKNSSYPWDGGCTNCIKYGDVSSNSVQIQMNDDSIPYVDSAGSIVGSGTFDFVDSFSANFQCRVQHEAYCATLSYVDSEKRYLSITIGTNVPSRVSNFEKPLILVSLIDEKSQFILCTLPLFKDAGSVELVDCLGKTVAILPAAPVCQVPNLPPGCYFARLGDEVAKFVVPPR